MDSSPLNSLPTELIFRILDFIEPHEYSGFSCTCQEAVVIVNRKLDNPKDKEKLYLDWAYNIVQSVPWRIAAVMTPCLNPPSIALFARTSVGHARKNP
jgi:hypothetical protein